MSFTWHLPRVHQSRAVYRESPIGEIDFTDPSFYYAKIDPESHLDDILVLFPATGQMKQTTPTPGTTVFTFPLGSIFIVPNAGSFSGQYESQTRILAEAGTDNICVVPRSGRGETEFANAGLYTTVFQNSLPRSLLQDRGFINNDGIFRFKFGHIVCGSGEVDILGINLVEAPTCINGFYWDPLIGACVRNDVPPSKYLVDLYEYLPQAHRDFDKNKELKGFCNILSSGLSDIKKEIDLIESFPELKHPWFMEAWSELLGFPELSEIFVYSDLAQVLPTFLRLIKMKGTRAPIAILTERLFSDIEPFNYYIPEVIDTETGLFVVTVEIPQSYPSKIQGVTASAYLASKINALNRLLIRFVPTYLDPVVDLKFSPHYDEYLFEINDDEFRIAVGFSDTNPTPTDDSELLSFFNQLYLEPVVIPTDVVPDQGPVLNDHILNFDAINAPFPESSNGFCDDSDLTITPG